MGKPTGFMEYPRELPDRRPIDERVHDYLEVYNPFSEEKLKAQSGAVHGLRHPLLPPGLPSGKPDPGLERPGVPRPVAHGHRPAARHEQLSRVHRQALPSPCEASCVLGINNDPVAIKQIEASIIERAWEDGWVRPSRPG